MTDFKCEKVVEPHSEGEFLVIVDSHKLELICSACHYDCHKDDKQRFVFLGTFLKKGSKRFYSAKEQGWAIFKQIEQLQKYFQGSLAQKVVMLLNRELTPLKLKYDLEMLEVKL